MNMKNMNKKNIIEYEYEYEYGEYEYAEYYRICIRI